jgi:hypothetical protein
LGHGWIYRPAMISKSLARMAGLLLMLSPVATFAAVIPYPPYPGAVPSESYKVTVNGQPVFVNRFLTYDQFNWMDYARFAMTGKVHVEITHLISERKVITCDVRPLAYGIHPKIDGNTVSFDLDQPRKLILFFNDEPLFYSTGLMLFADPPEQNPSRPGDTNVVNIMDYHVDNTGRTLETTNINQAISDVSARPGGGVLYFPPGVYLTGTVFMKSNVQLYVDAGALILGSRQSADYTGAPTPSGGRSLRAFFVFDHVEAQRFVQARHHEWRVVGSAEQLERAGFDLSVPVPTTRRCGAVLLRSISSAGRRLAGRFRRGSSSSSYPRRPCRAGISAGGWSSTARENVPPSKCSRSRRLKCPREFSVPARAARFRAADGDEVVDGLHGGRVAGFIEHLQRGVRAVFDRAAGLKTSLSSTSSPASRSARR